MYILGILAFLSLLMPSTSATGVTVGRFCTGARTLDSHRPLDDADVSTPGSKPTFFHRCHQPRQYKYPRPGVSLLVARGQDEETPGIQDPSTSHQGSSPHEIPSPHVPSSPQQSQPQQDDVPRLMTFRTVSVRGPSSPQRDASSHETSGSSRPHQIQRFHKPSPESSSSHADSSSSYRPSSSDESWRPERPAKRPKPGPKFKSVTALMSQPKPSLEAGPSRSYQPTRLPSIWGTKGVRTGRVPTGPEAARPGPSERNKPRHKANIDVNRVPEIPKGKDDPEGIERPVLLFHSVVPDPKRFQGVRKLGKGDHQHYYRKISDSKDTPQAEYSKVKWIESANPTSAIAISRRQKRKYGRVRPSKFEERVTTGHEGFSSFTEWHEITPKRQEDLPAGLQAWTGQQLGQNLILQGQNFKNHEAGRDDSVYAGLDLEMRTMCHTKQCKVQPFSGGPHFGFLGRQRAEGFEGSDK